jgi:hypothetical protein
MTTMEQNSNSMESKHIIIILVVSLLLLAFPVVLRWHYSNPYLVGGESYKTLDDIQHSALFQFVLLQKNFSYVQEHLIMLIILAQLVLGLLAMLIYYEIIAKLSNPETALFSALALLFSPITFFLFTTLNTFGLALFFALAGFWFFLKDSKIAILLFMLVPVLNVYIALLTFVFLFLYVLFHSEKLQLFYFILVPCSLVGIYLLFVQPVYLHWFIDHNQYDFLSLLGSLSGYAVPFLLIAIIGFIYEYRKKLLWPFLMVFIATALSFFSALSRMIIVFVLAFFVGSGIVYLRNRQWDIYKLKNITMLLIFCSFLFTSVSFAQFLARQQPDAVYSKTMYFVQEKTPENAMILSSEQNGLLLQHLINRSTYLDEESYLHFDYDYKSSVTDTLYQLRDLDRAKRILNDAGITHVFVDPAMKSALWKNKDDGLYFLMNHNKEFILLYDRDGYQLWKYAP